MPLDFDETFEDLALELEALLRGHDKYPDVPLDISPRSVRPEASGHSPSCTTLQSRPKRRRNCGQPINSEAPSVMNGGPSIKTSHSSDNQEGCMEESKKVQCPKQGGKPSRWCRDKSKMGTLKQQHELQQALAETAERENRQLKLKATAMEHVLAARERQLSILAQYQKLCGPGSTLQASEEAKSWHEVAASSMKSLAGKLLEFVDEVKWLIEEITDNEQRRDMAANEPILHKLAPIVSAGCTLMGQAFTLNPAMQFQMLVYRVDMDGPGDPPSQAHWDHVVTEMRITQQQVDEVAACWELGNSSMAKSQNELFSAQKDLAQADDRLRLLELRKVLSAAMYSESAAYRTLCFTLYGRILTHLQVAKMGVLSLPYFPNARELMAGILRVHTPSISESA